MVEAQIFILHWSSTAHIYPNQFTVEAIRSIQELTDGSYEIIVVDNYSDDDAVNDLIAKIPSDVIFVKNDRISRSVNSGRNKIWSMVDADYFAVLHTDIRVSKGWLRNMLAELKMAEEKYQKPCVISPLYLPYFISDQSLYDRFSSHFTVNTLEKLEARCKSCRGVSLENGRVSCGSYGFYTDDGHQLMIFLTSKRFRDKVGEWDEHYVGGCYDDCDMGMTAILKGCKNLQSQTVYIQHLQGVSIGFGALQDEGINAEAFRKKWGEDTFNKLQTGRLWIDLHNRGSQNHASELF
jgi:GT2 family glycosyltransferase